MNRKYIRDYVVEEVLSADGGRGSRWVYRGVYYRFRNDKAVIRRLRIWILAAAATVIMLILPLFCLNTNLGRTLYVLLPAALAAMPLYGLLAAARRLALTQTPFTREHRDKTDGWIRSATVWLTVLLGTSCAGCWIRGFGSEEATVVTGLHLALLVSVCLLTQRNKGATLPVET